MLPEHEGLLQLMCPCIRQARRLCCRVGQIAGLSPSKCWRSTLQCTDTDVCYNKDAAVRAWNTSVGQLDPGLQIQLVGVV